MNIEREDAEQGEQPRPIDKSESTGLDLEELISQLQSAATSRRRLQTRADTIADDLSEISTQIESLRLEIEDSEANLIAKSLRKTEAVYQLAMHKLLENGICPACGTYQREMQDSAQENARNHQCLLCGSEDPQETNSQLTTLRTQLSEKLRAQQDLEKKYHNISARLQAARRNEA